MSQAEIENELRKHGSGFQDGKQRIIELYQTQPDRKLRAKALAKEYGIGGHSQDFLDGSSGFVNHDGKGLEFDHYPDHQKVTLSWTQVEKYIDLMIQSDRYLTDKEKEHRAAVQEAERQLPMLDGDAAAEYNALKEQYPNTLIGFELGGYFLFYDKDAITVKEVFRSNLLSQENALGKVKVTGFLRREWVAKSQKLWAEGNSIYLAGQGGDGTHHQTKYLREEDYLPIGIIIKLDGRDFRVDHVNFMFKSVSLQDMDLTNSGQPIFRVERLPNIRELYEQQQDEIIDVSPEKAVDYKVGDEVVVDLPTRTIEGKIGYVGETDVRIDTSAHGQSWDNEVLNKQQFEDGLRRDEPTPDEELDKLPISVEVNGEWQTFPDAAAADEALNAEPMPEAAGNFHITDDNLGVGGPKQKFARNIEAIQTLRTLEQEHPQRRTLLVKRYNELFNSTRPREYDGSHIHFVGMNPEINLREHQRNAIAHVLYGHNTLLAHEVGAGKTFEMAAAAMESKRLGLCQKSLFVVPNHLTEQWAAEFLHLYPNAKLLVTSKKDFEPGNRKTFCSRIATGDYDAVIIGHSQFEKIPLSAERQERLIQEQMDEIEEAIEEAKALVGEHFTVKQLEKLRKSLKQKLEKLQGADRKDDVVTFEQLGVDRLFVDESQNYKNLFLYTKMRNVAGLSTSEAQKSSDMFGKCRYLDEITGGRGVIFATGTPISNSMTEMYTLMRYLQYNTLQQKGLTHFDAWASTFGETTTAIELAPEGYT